MLEQLQKKVEGLAEDYVDLLKVQITQAKNSDVNDSDTVTPVCEIHEGIRVLNHISSVLERIDRIQRRNACGQGLGLDN